MILFLVLIQRLPLLEGSVGVGEEGKESWMINEDYNQEPALVKSEPLQIPLGFALFGTECQAGLVDIPKRACEYFHCIPPGLS
jgi:hypothetical protein